MEILTKHHQNLFKNYVQALYFILQINFNQINKFHYNGTNCQFTNKLNAFNYDYRSEPIQLNACIPLFNSQPILGSKLQLALFEKIKTNAIN